MTTPRDPSGAPLASITRLPSARSTWQPRSVAIWTQPGMPTSAASFADEAARLLRRRNITTHVLSSSQWGDALAREKGTHAWGRPTPTPTHSGLGVDLHLLTGGMDPLVGDLSPALRLRVRLVAELCALARQGGTPVLALSKGAQLVARSIADDAVIALPAPRVGMEQVCDPTGMTPPRTVALTLAETLNPTFADRLDIEVLRTSPGLPVQAFAWGRGVVAAQYAPDWSAEYLAKAVSRHGRTLTARGGNRRRVTADLQAQIAADTWSEAALADLLDEVAAARVTVRNLRTPAAALAMD